MPRRVLLLAVVLVPLAGCDQLGLESATVTAARVEADGKAVGAACRHGGRAIEDCFTLNRKTDKAAIYSGWREMDDYMRENKIEAVAPVLPPPQAKKPKPADAGGDAASDDADAKPDAASDDKPVDKPADKPAKPVAAVKPAVPAKPAADKPGDAGPKTAEPH